VVAAIVGPPLFREHLHRAGVSHDSLEQFHAEEAYRYATVLSVGGALTVSALTALAVSWYVSRRLQRSVTEVASAATAVAHGRYGTRVSSPRLGDDFDTLTEAFNQMAARLQTVYVTRRQLFGDLAHEIRTPVAVLEAYMEALEDGVRSPNPATTTMLREQTPGVSGQDLRAQPTTAHRQRWWFLSRTELEAAEVNSHWWPGR
jgi:signal transduction histidine kinase